MNTLPDYVASPTLQNADWNNATILHGNVSKEVAKLKQEPGENIQIAGGVLLASASAPPGGFVLHLAIGRPGQRSAATKLTRTAAAPIAPASLAFAVGPSRPA
jgi:hypothetical protein